MPLLALVVAVAALQQPPPRQALPREVGDTSTFRPLDLPAPTLLRTGAGTPGPAYWQQRADYDLDASLDTASQTVTGRETIRYTNHSPDTLRYVWLQLDQNLYRADSRGAALAPPDARFAGEGFQGGYTIDALAAVRTGPGQGPRTVPLASTLNGTMLRVDLDEPLVPGGTATIDVSYRFVVPEHGSDRMGRERVRAGWLYEIAQWYPRLAVYDDVRGWNTDQYLGQGEFYLEYGDFDVRITVPRNFVIAATGTLLNPSDVLTPAERGRLALAIRSDTTVPIIGRADAGEPRARPAGASGLLTWHFSATNVRDVAWAAAPAFIWDASGWRGTLIEAFYPPEASPDWENAATYARHSIQHYSEKWMPYPYPTATAVAGPAGGMEYPMIVFCGERFSGFDLYGVETHELGHQWFPMVVGSNERRYALMDEGFDTFLNIYSVRSFYPDSLWEHHRGDPQAWARVAAAGRDVPTILPADRIPYRLLGAAEYTKPATGLYLLRHYILDDTTRFDAAFREYIRRWAYKHPTPADFFRTMDDALGEDLSWFWRGWFYTTDVVDQAIDSVTTIRDLNGGWSAAIFLSNLGALPMPVVLQLTLVTGATERERLPVEVWFQGDHYTFTTPLAGELIKVELDPDSALPDVRRDNNTWTKATP